MLCVNSILYENGNIEQFINDSVNCMIMNMPGLNMRKEYWLFYFIQEDFRTNLWSLYQINIDADIFGFPNIRKNTRHAIEAFLDLYNLCSDSDYIELLKFCSKQTSNIEKYEKYLYNEQFTIFSKCKIAREMYGKDFNFLIDISKKSNEFIHPNVFIDIIPIERRDEKQKILKELVCINCYLLSEAYLLLLKQFNNNKQPYIGCKNCMGNGNCNGCYRYALDKFNGVADRQLLIEIYPQINYFNR